MIHKLTVGGIGQPCLGDQQIAWTLGAHWQQHQLENGRYEGNAQQEGPPLGRAQYHGQAENLREQQANGDAKLADRAQCAAQRHGRNLGQVHRHKGCVEATGEANEEAAHHQALDALEQVATAHQGRAQYGNGVVQQETTFTVAKGKQKATLNRKHGKLP